MPIYSDLTPDELLDAERLARSTGELRRIDAGNGRVLFFRNARVPWVDLDTIWRELDLDRRMSGLPESVLGYAEDTFDRIYLASRMPLVVTHHDGSVTIADLECSHTHTFCATKPTRRERLRTWRSRRRRCDA